MYNDIYKFVVDNSGLLLALLLALVGLFQALYSKNKQEVYANIPGLIASAQALEIANDSKFQKVLDISYGLIPGVFKIFISEQDLSRHIQFIFDRLKQFAKEQAKAEAIKAQALLIENNIANKVVTPEQLAIAMKELKAEQQGTFTPGV